MQYPRIYMAPLLMVYWSYIGIPLIAVGQLMVRNCHVTSTICTSTLKGTKPQISLNMFTARSRAQLRHHVITTSRRDPDVTLEDDKDNENESDMSLRAENCQSMCRTNEKSPLGYITY